MRITTPETAPKVPFNIEAYSLYKSDEAELIHMVLQPGQAIAMHSNPFKVVFFCIEGEVVATVEDESVQMNRFSSVVVEKDLNRREETERFRSQLLGIRGTLVRDNGLLNKEN